MIKPRDEKFLKEHGVTSWGSYNEAPTPIEKCDMSVFWHEFAMYGLGKIDEEESRQVSLEGRLVSGHILVYHDKIFLLESRWNGVNNKFFGECWLIGCNHEYSSVNTGRCLHQLTCKKCGYSYEVDSSD